ncbi:MAG: hypothetical protein ACXWX7_12385, partial [Candidatus Binatia bacterium]
GWDDSKVYVNLSRGAIENAPEYNPDALNREYEGKLYDHYERPKYWDSPGGRPSSASDISETR